MSSTESVPSSGCIFIQSLAKFSLWPSRTDAATGVTPCDTNSAFCAVSLLEVMTQQVFSCVMRYVFLEMDCERHSIPYTALQLVLISDDNLS